MRLRVSAAALLALLAAPAGAQALVSPAPEAGGWFGAAVASVPDADGDGVDDVLVGAYREDVAGVQDAGRAHLYSGATGALLQTLVSPVPERFAYFGKAVAGVPDVDGDGRGDLAVGAPFDVHTNATGVGPTHAEGRVYVFSGATGALLQTLAPPTQAGGFVGIHFGWSLAGLRDLNGDGRGELAVGMPYANPVNFTNYFPGAVYVYSAASGAPARRFTSPSPDYDGYYGWAVAAVPDLDGDGLDDLAIGTPFEELVPVPSINYGNEGRVHLVNPATGARIRTVLSPDPQTVGFFGWSVAGVPDTDGDGLGDVLVGAPYEQAAGAPQNAGRAYLVTASGTSTLRSPAEAEAGLFGWAVAGVPDVDGDGRGDLLVGAPSEPRAGAQAAGGATLFSGATRAVLRTLASPAPAAENNAGYAVAGARGADGRGAAIVAAYRERGSENGAVYRFDADGALLPAPAPAAPALAVRAPSRAGVCTDNVLLVPNTSNAVQDNVAVFSAETGALREPAFVTDRRGPNFPLFAGPTPARDGILVTDLGRDLIFEIGCDGRVVRYSLFAFGDNSDVVNFPATAGLSPDGTRVWVAMGNGALGGQVVEFDAAGTLLRTVIPEGVLGAARSIVPYQGGLLISDSADDTVKRFALDGSFLGVFTPFGTPLNRPGQIALAPDGAVLVAGQDAPKGVYAYDASGAALGFTPTAAGPNGLAALAGGRLLVATETGVDVGPRGGPFVRVASGDFQNVGAFLAGGPVAGAVAPAASRLALSVSPNPARGAARVAFETAEPGPVRVSIYDVLGRRAAVVFDAALPAGAHAEPLDTSALPPGLYLVRLDAAGAARTARLTVLPR